jgi:hypothetical protein
MTRTFHRLLCLLVAHCLIAAALVATGCRRAFMSHPSSSASSGNMPPGTFITTTGHYYHTNGIRNVTINITANPTGAITCAFHSTDYRGGGSATRSTTIPPATPSSPWFIFAEDERNYWIFDGGKKLDHLASEGGISSETVIDNGKLTGSAAGVPTDVAARLPEELRKLLPADKATPPPPRPSL